METLIRKCCVACRCYPLEGVFLNVRATLIIKSTRLFQHKGFLLRLFYCLKSKMIVHGGMTLSAASLSHFLTAKLYLLGLSRKREVFFLLPCEKSDHICLLHAVNVYYSSYVGFWKIYKTSSTVIWMNLKSKRCLSIDRARAHSDLKETVKEISRSFLTRVSIVEVG